MFRERKRKCFTIFPEHTHNTSEQVRKFNAKFIGSYTGKMRKQWRQGDEAPVTQIFARVFTYYMSVSDTDDEFASIHSRRKKNSPEITTTTNKVVAI